MNLILPLLSVVFGFLIAFWVKEGARPIQLLLSYSGAFLLSVTVFEFLPSVYENYNPTTGIFIMCGVLLQVLLEFLSKGAEHGHLHQDKHNPHFPVLLFVSLCIHSFMEGFPIAENKHLLWGVVIHKIPVAVIISSFLLNSALNHTKTTLFLVFFALMTPLGSAFSQFFVFSEQTVTYINALVVGIFLHVSTTILFESSKNHQFNRTKIAAIISGVLTAWFI